MTEATRPARGDPTAGTLGEWAKFFAIWGSSFLWIKVALGNDGQPFLGIDLPPGTVAFTPLLLVIVRLTLGAIGLGVIARARGVTVPLDRATLSRFAFMGVFYAAIPFGLITWGETRIDSGLAAILNGTVPLFTIVIAHAWLTDERATPARLAGLAVGFGGVVILLSRSFGTDEGQGSMLGLLAVLGAAASYGLSSTFSRRHLRGQSPVAQSLVTMLVGDVVIIAALLAAPQRVDLPGHPLLWFAAVWLGLLGSCTAYILYFSLVNAWGPTRASLVTYVFPIVGVALGVLTRSEVIDWRLVAGTALIASGIAVVNLVPRSAGSRRNVRARGG